MSTNVSKFMAAEAKRAAKARKTAIARAKLTAANHMRMMADAATQPATAGNKVAYEFPMSPDAASPFYRITFDNTDLIISIVEKNAKTGASRIHTSHFLTLPFATSSVYFCRNETPYVQGVAAPPPPPTGADGTDAGTDAAPPVVGTDASEIAAAGSKRRREDTAAPAAAAEGADVDDGETTEPEEWQKKKARDANDDEAAPPCPPVSPDTSKGAAAAPRVARPYWLITTSDYDPCDKDTSLRGIVWTPSSSDAACEDGELLLWFDEDRGDEMENTIATHMCIPMSAECARAIWNFFKDASDEYA